MRGRASLVGIVPASAEGIPAAVISANVATSSSSRRRDAVTDFIRFISFVSFVLGRPSQRSRPGCRGRA
jgi:hypothetical protein